MTESHNNPYNWRGDFKISHTRNECLVEREWYTNWSFSIEMPDGYACKLGPHGGCQKLNTCKN